MHKIICVDDEPLVLKLNVTLCGQLRQKPEAEGFASAEEALAYFDTETADIAILDINIPDMDGLMLAARIKEKSPDTAILFLTGYSQYAMEAIRLHASGYLMKPVSLERLQEEVDYIEGSMKGVSPKKAALSKKNIQVRTFGEFDVFVDGEPVHFKRSKSKELLAYLVDRQGAGINRRMAYAILWENGEYSRSAQKQLDVMIRSLKNTLDEYGIGEIFELSKGELRIRPKSFSCDLYSFLDGDIDAVNSYKGEYMSSYSWAALTEAYIDRVGGRI